MKNHSQYISKQSIKGFLFERILDMTIAHDPVSKGLAPLMNYQTKKNGLLPVDTGCGTGGKKCVWCEGRWHVGGEEGGGNARAHVQACVEQD